MPKAGYPFTVCLLLYCRNRICAEKAVIFFFYREIQGGMKMSTTVNGLGSANCQSLMTGTLTIKNANKSYGSMTAARKTTKKTTKSLNYNHREISGQLVRAKKAQSASVVLTRAKSKVAVLQRAAGTGQYNQTEVANALAHARRMVRCAQLKVRNLKEEEREQKANQKESGAKSQQKQSKVKRRVAAKERELKKKVAIEETQEVIKEKRKRNEMAQKRRTHRNQERGKIAEADMKYLKAMCNSGSGGSSYDEASGVAIHISNVAIALADLALTEKEKEAIEQEAEAEVEAEMALEPDGTTDTCIGGDMNAPVMNDGAAAGGEVPVAVDVSV